MARVKDIIEGLVILSKYTDKGLSEQIGGAEHDIIYGPPVSQDAVSRDDQERLDELAWFWSSEFSCWSHFV